MTKGKRFAIALALVGAFAPGAGAEEAQAPARPANPMMELVRKHDQKMDELLAKMNEAKGEAKVDAIAAVLNEMVTQKKETRQQMNAGRGMRRGSRAQPPEAKPAE
jgi:hypothetical protein